MIHTAFTATRYTTIAGAILLVLSNLILLMPVQAESVIDYIDSARTDQTEIYTLHFNYPAQYLYHTPENNTNHTLIALSLHPFKQNTLPVDQRLPRPASDWLDDIEFFRQEGFNSHLYLKFNVSADISVKNTSDLRGLIITVEQTDHSQAPQQ